MTNQSSEYTERLTRAQERCTVVLIIRDSAGYATYEQLAAPCANRDDAVFLVNALLNHVDDELTYLEEQHDELADAQEALCF